MVPIKVRKALRALVDARDRRALLQGVAASLEHATVLRSLPTAKTVIDIGANRGQFILEAIKWHPNANFIAFEPLSPQRALMELVLRGLPRLTIHPIALGDTDTCAQFNVSASADCSSILKQTPLQAQSFPGTENVGQQKVCVRRLEHLLNRSEFHSPVICKIDVQGYELNVLRGFGDLLDAVDYLIVELTNVAFYEGAANSSEVIAYLVAREFRILGIYDMYLQDQICVQANFLFSREVKK
jgi:FkbM family methyltransferase